MITWMVILAHLCNLQSLGVPYMSPVAPLRISDMGDYIYRRPWRWMRQRPALTAEKNITRQQGVEEDEDEGR
ncbi:MAG: spore germination protein [Firmicutes bacterium]|nr:spore germination protein [Bacillota bacterium]